MNHLTEFQLNEYLDGELDTTERRAVATHLAACADCQEALAELQALFWALDEVAEVELTADLSPRVLAALRPSTAPVPWLRPLLLIQAAAAAGMVVWLWPTLRELVFLGTTAVTRALSTLTPPQFSLWQQLLGWGTAVLQQSDRLRPAIPLAANQWAILIALALALWLTGSQLIFKDNP